MDFGLARTAKKVPSRFKTCYREKTLKNRRIKMEDNKANTEKIDETKVVTPPVKPEDNKGGNTVPLHTHIELRKEKNKYKDESQDKDEYVKLVKKLQKVSGKTVAEIEAELDGIESKSPAPTKTTQANPDSEALSELTNSINRLENENKVIRMGSEFDSQVKSEEFRSAREHREKILKFAIEKDIPLGNAIYAVCGDTIALDKAKLNLSKDESGNSAVEIDTTNGGSYNVGSDNKARSAKLAEGINMGTAEYDLFRKGDPKTIHEYYKKQHSKK